MPLDGSACYRADQRISYMGEITMDKSETQAHVLATSLNLSMPPVAMALCDVVPDQVPEFGEVVPAGCSFWQQAATRTFATSAKDHALCSVGIHTHNMADAPSSCPTAPEQP